MICVLDILSGPAAGKRIWLKENQCLEIGRMSTVDFPIPSDNHLSRRHLLIDSTDNTFRVRDVGSSNGTFLNNKRIEVHLLQEGDILRAGSSTFSVSILENGENPHKIDGTSFGKTLARALPEPNTNSGTMRSLDFPEDYIVAKDEIIQRDEINADIQALTSSKDNGETNRPSIAFDAESTVLFHSQSQREDSNDSMLLRPTESNTTPVDVFQSTDTPRLFSLNPEYQSEIGTFCGALKAIAAGKLVTLIINRSQLAPSALATLTSISKNLNFQWLSQSLLITSQPPSSELWPVVNATLHQDAVLCLVHEHAVNNESLVEHANSLGYPSLFGRHISDLTSPVRHCFAKLGIQVLFESSRDGKIFLFR